MFTWLSSPTKACPASNRPPTTSCKGHKRRDVHFNSINSNNNIKGNYLYGVEEAVCRTMDGLIIKLLDLMCVYSPFCLMLQMLRNIKLCKCLDISEVTLTGTDWDISMLTCTQGEAPFSLNWEFRCGRKPTCLTDYNFFSHDDGATYS